MRPKLPSETQAKMRSNKSVSKRGDYIYKMTYFHIYIYTIYFIIIV